MSASAVSARRGRDAPMRLGAQPADAAPQGRRQNFLVSAGLAAATLWGHLNAMCGRFASYLPPEAIAVLFR